ncbi:MAG TPA: DUF2391 family protein, partial [Spirochaetota bacterium]|nr:DUF2391 family protein [Spirochaetota bacterium]
MDEKKENFKIRRIGGYLHKVVEIADSAGKGFNFVVQPLMTEFRPRDLMQVVVGASMLAVPVAFTEETWSLGEKLPLFNVILLSIISLCFISGFVYLNFYRFMLKDNIMNFLKRTLSIYIFSLIVVGTILTIIQKCPWG